jgi:hypothetical protein
VDEEIDDLAEVTIGTRRHELSPAEQRRIVVRMVLRVLGTLVAIIVVYALIPFETSETWTVVVVTILGLSVIVTVGIVQIRAIAHARLPSIQAVETLGLLIPLVVFWFAAAYFALSASSAGSFNEELDHVGAAYFSLTTLTTIGYGDISAQTDTARIFVMVQMVVDVLVIGLAVRLAVVAVRRNLASTPEELAAARAAAAERQRARRRLSQRTSPPPSTN